MNKKFEITAAAIDNAIVDELNDLWAQDFAQTAADIATLIRQGLEDVRAHHKERVRGAIEGVITHLLNKVWEHHQAAEWGDIDGVHTSLETRYKAVLGGVITWVDNDIGNITLRLSALNTEALEAVDASMAKTVLASGKIRYVPTEESQQARARLRAVLHGKMPSDSVDSLMGALERISARELKRQYFDTYKLGRYFAMKSFFECVEAAVPNRRGQRGWNYKSFKSL